MSGFCFNEKKATQLAAAFISLEGGAINYTKLIKLMYLADRSALVRWERSITGDSYVAMKLGPVLSNTYDLIKSEEASDSPWFSYISEKDGYCVSLRQQCLPKNLSRAEEKVIAEIFETYGHYDYKQLVDIVHKLPEWEDPSPLASAPISIRSIFQGEGLPESEIADIENELDRVRRARAAFGCR